MVSEPKIALAVTEDVVHFRHRFVRREQLLQPVARSQDVGDCNIGIRVVLSEQVFKLRPRES
jgi:hypothetical protein